MIHLRSVSQGVFYSTTPIPVADANTVALLKDAAAQSKLKRARLCLHPSPDSLQHDMLIVSHRDTYVCPHKHLTRSESVLVIEGKAKTLVFEDDGRLRDVVSMAPFGFGSFLYRMPVDVFHSLKIESEYLVFVESTKGPFLKDDCVNAPWAPDYHDAEGGLAYLRGLKYAANS